MTSPLRSGDVFPVQDTNVPLVLSESLEREYPLVLKRIELVRANLAALDRYACWMQQVAAVAGIVLRVEEEDDTPLFEDASPRVAVLPDGERVPIISFAHLHDEAQEASTPAQ